MQQQLSESSRTKIEVDQLTPGEIATLFERYDSVVSAMIASDNTLLVKLAAVPETNDAHVTILNDWSAFNTFLMNALRIEVEKAGSASH